MYTTQEKWKKNWPYYILNMDHDISMCQYIKLAEKWLRWWPPKATPILNLASWNIARNETLVGDLGDPHSWSTNVYKTY